MSRLLTTYAADISELHQKAHKHAGVAIQCAVQAGQLLIAAKANIEHGGWLLFVESTGIGIRAAQGYMKLARNEDALNTQGIAHLGIEKALKILANPKSLPDDDFNPPEAGEYWACIFGSYFEFVWPYGDGKYQYLYGHPFLNEDSEEMGYPLIHTTLKPVSWR